MENFLKVFTNFNQDVIFDNNKYKIYSINVNLFQDEESVITDH